MTKERRITLNEKPISRQAVHIKTGRLYTVLYEDAINATNKDDGKEMVIYRRSSPGKHQLFCRDKEEFLQKFVFINTD